MIAAPLLHLLDGQLHRRKQIRGKEAFSFLEQALPLIKQWAAVLVLQRLF